MKRVFVMSIAMLLFSGIIALGIWGWVQWRYERLVQMDLATTACRPVAIVFGAGIRPDGRLSPMLRPHGRGHRAVPAGKVRKLLVSGDNRFVDYNEPGRMYDYAVAAGVPAEDVVRDYAGRRTYDTCYRAHAIFGVVRRSW